MMKNELLKALYPVKQRLRRNRLLRGAAWGLAAGLGAALLLRLVALFIPLADRWLWAVLPVAMLTLLFAAGNALRPVTDRTAAEAADRCGLKERTITALEQAEMADRSELPSAFEIRGRTPAAPWKPWMSAGFAPAA